MKSAVPLFALGGAVILIAALSSKKSPTTTQKQTGSTISGKKVDPTVPKKPPSGLKSIGDSGSGGTSQGKCDVLTEYYDVKTKQCVKFWQPGETEIKIEHTINEVLSEMSKKNDTSKICTESDENTPNPMAIELIKEVLYREWNIPKDVLPPNNDPLKGSVPPEWISMVWNRVVDIYLDKICQSGFDPYA